VPALCSLQGNSGRGGVGMQRKGGHMDSSDNFQSMHQSGSHKDLAAGVKDKLLQLQLQGQPPPGSPASSEDSQFMRNRAQQMKQQQGQQMQLPPGAPTALRQKPLVIKVFTADRQRLEEYPVWWYLDSNSEIQGPFSSEMMMTWHLTGDLPHDLPACGTQGRGYAREQVRLDWFEPLQVIFERVAKGAPYHPPDAPAHNEPARSRGSGYSTPGSARAQQMQMNQRQQPQQSQLGGQHQQMQQMQQQGFPGNLQQGFAGQHQQMQHQQQMQQMQHQQFPGQQPLPQQQHQMGGQFMSAPQPTSQPGGFPMQLQAQQMPPHSHAPPPQPQLLPQPRDNPAPNNLSWGSDAIGGYSSFAGGLSDGHLGAPDSSSRFGNGMQGLGGQGLGDAGGLLDGLQQQQQQQLQAGDLGSSLSGAQDGLGLGLGLGSGSGAPDQGTAAYPSWQLWSWKGLGQQDAQ
jgi:hypothetical protein